MSLVRPQRYVAAAYNTTPFTTAPNLTITNTTNGVTITVSNGTPGTLFTIQATDDLSTAQWNDIANITIDPNGQASHSEPRDRPRRFFRGKF